MDYRLALDLSNKYISYSLTGIKEPLKFIKTGIHYFEDGRDPKTRDSLAKGRRTSRIARRNRDRKLQRKHSLIHKFIKYGLIDEDEKRTHAMKALDRPYYYRNLALSTKLSKLELAWALFNLNQKRGFQNFKTKEEDKEKGIILKSQAIMLDDMGSGTAGSYLYKRSVEGLPTRSRLADNIFPSRQMLENEFDCIKEIQRQYHPDLSDEFWDSIRHTIFYQRPLKEVKCGQCILFTGETRAYRGLPSYRRLKLLETLSTIKIKKNNKFIELSNDIKRDLYEKLLKLDCMQKKDLTSLLCKLKTEKVILGKKEIVGDPVSFDLSKEDFFGEKWFSLSLQDQDDIVHILITKEIDYIYNLAITEWELPPLNAKNVSEYLVHGINAVTQSFSRKALYLLVDEMEKRFISIPEARKQIGYPEITYKGEFDTLNYYGQVLPHIVSTFRHTDKPADLQTDDELYGSINNPSLHIVFNRMRKIVNALIANYGKPSQIVVKLESELKHSYEVQEERRKLRDNNYTEIKSIKDILITVFKIEKPTIHHIQTYKLWIELNPKDPEFRFCPFTGSNISKQNLFSAEYTTAHIIPFEKCYDNSIRNKILISTNVQDKFFNKGPYEAFCMGGSDQIYDQVLKRIKYLPKEKQTLFEKNAVEVIKKKVTQQFTDRAYISKSIKEYLSTICVDSWITNERLISILRKAWGCRDWMATINPDIKHRRDDLRYPIIDAMILGTVNSDLSILSKFKLNKKIDANEMSVVKPWDTFDTDAIAQLTKDVVSYRVNHSKAGKFLQDGAYGSVDPEKHNGFNLCTRKSIFEVSPDKIADNRIRDRLITHLSNIPDEPNDIRRSLKNILEKKSNSIKDAKINNKLLEYIKKIPEKKEAELKKRLVQEELIVFSEITGIKSVKVLVNKSRPIIIKHKDGTGKEYFKAQLSAENYSVSIWALPFGSSLRNEENFDIVKLTDFKTRFVVTAKTLFNCSIYDKPHPAAKLIMSLKKNDMIACTNERNETYIARVSGLDPSGKRIFCCKHNSGDKILRTYRQLVSTMTQKVAVNPTGDVKIGENKFKKYKID